MLLLLQLGYSQSKCRYPELDLQQRQMLRAKDPSVVCVWVTSVTIHSWKQMEQFILQYSCIFALYLNED